MSKARTIRFADLMTRPFEFSPIASPESPSTAMETISSDASQSEDGTINDGGPASDSEDANLASQDVTINGTGEATHNGRAASETGNDESGSSQAPIPAQSPEAEPPLPGDKELAKDSNSDRKPQPSSASDVPSTVSLSKSRLSEASLPIGDLRANESDLPDPLTKEPSLQEETKHLISNDEKEASPVVTLPSSDIARAIVDENKGSSVVSENSPAAAGSGISSEKPRRAPLSPSASIAVSGVSQPFDASDVKKGKVAPIDAGTPNPPNPLENVPVDGLHLKGDVQMKDFDRKPQSNLITAPPRGDVVTSSTNTLSFPPLQGISQNATQQRAARPSTREVSPSPYGGIFNMPGMASVFPMRAEGGLNTSQVASFSEAEAKAHDLGLDKERRLEVPSSTFLKNGRTLVAVETPAVRLTLLTEECVGNLRHRSGDIKKLKESIQRALNGEDAPLYSTLKVVGELGACDTLLQAAAAEAARLLG